MRLGPSASQVLGKKEWQKHVDLDTVLGCLTALMQCKDTREKILTHLGNTSFDEDADAVEDARSGLPSSARPSQSSLAATPAAAVAPEAIETPEEEAEEEAEVEEPAAEQAQVINSSSHRREHARLSRRMHGLCATKFPEMHRLWAGTRQD